MEMPTLKAPLAADEYKDYMMDDVEFGSSSKGTNEHATLEWSISKYSVQIANGFRKKPTEKVIIQDIGQYGFD